MSNFSLDDILGHNLSIPQKFPQIKITGSREVFVKAFEYFLEIENKGKIFNWKDGYQDICEWLSDNKGTGLMILGSCSLGKTFISRYVLPAILLKYHGIVLKNYDLQRDNIDLILSKKICGLDDIGTEDIRNEFGTKRMAFSEIVDNAEKNSNLLIITTNLTGDEIKKRYGVRVYERLLAITKRVIIEGNGERK